jgi:hypothetical protein
MYMWNWLRWTSGTGRGKDTEGEEDGSSLHTPYQDSRMKPTKCCSKEGEEGEGDWDYNGGELVQRTLYACIELSQ